MGEKLPGIDDSPWLLWIVRMLMSSASPPLQFTSVNVSAAVPSVSL
jgi:hypothetical protein